MTYFLCRHYTVHFGQLVPNTYMHIVVRPCKWSYRKVLSFLNGKVKETLELGGQVASFTVSHSYKYSYGFAQQPHFDTFEEWMIWLNCNKGIMPDFEEVYYSADLKDYIAKTTDLRTNTVLYDKSAELKQLLCRKIV